MSSSLPRRGQPAASRGGPWLLLALLLFTLPAAFYPLSGCSSGGTQPFPGGDPAALQPAFGAVEGFVIRDGSRATGIVVVPALKPTDTNVLRNAVVRIVGGGQQQAVTDARGHFKLTGVPPGLRRLRVEVPGIGGEEFPLTVLADATIQVGERAVTRAQAIEKAKQAVAALGVDLAAARLMAAQQPFPAGTRIAPAYLDAERENLALFTRTLDRPAWFVYADRNPGQRFEHDVDFVFVDVETGAVSQDVRGSFPAVNGRAYYGKESLNAQSPDLVQAPTTRSARSSTGQQQAVTPGGGVALRARLSADAPCVAPPPKDGRTRGRDHTVPPCDDPKVYTILINGDLRADMALDVQNMQDFLRTDRFSGLGASDVFTYRPPETGLTPNALGRIEQQFDNICRVARPCDTVMIYASSHGSRLGAVIVERGPGEDGGAVGVAGYFYPQYLPYWKCAACHFIVIADCCFSGVIVEDIKKTVTESDLLYKGKKFVAMSAAGTQQWSFGEPGFLFTSATGGYFTNALFESMNEVAAGSAGGTVSLNNMQDVFDRAYGKTVAATRDMRNAPKDYPETFGQDPQFWQRELKPGETCLSGPTPSPSPVTGTPTPTPTPSPVTQPNRAPVLTRMSNVFLPDLHSNAFQVDAEDPDGDTLTYEWTWQGPATACGQDRGPGAGGAKTRIYLHDGCSFAAEQATTVTVTVRDGKGGESRHTLGLRQEGLFNIP